MEVSAKIARQVEFYFSDANLRRDKFLREQLKKNADGFVPVTVLLTFNRLKALCTEVERVVEAISSESQLLKLNDERNSIARISPYVDATVSNDHIRLCSAYLNRIPADATIESLREYLSQFGEVSLVRIPKNKADTERTHRGFAFVEFTSPDAVAKLVAAIPRKPSQEGSDEPIPESDETEVKVKSEETEVKVKSEETEVKVKSEETEVKDKSEGDQSETQATDTSDDAKPKPMYALTLSEWREWSTTLRKLKKAGIAPESKSAPKVDVQPNEAGRMVRVSGNLEGATKHDLKAIFVQLGDIKYVDFYGDAKFATLRFASAEIAQQVVDKVAEGDVKFGENVLEACVLTAEEQEKYWERVHTETATRAAMPKFSRRQQSKNDKKRNRQPVSAAPGSLKKAKASEESVSA